MSDGHDNGNGFASAPTPPQFPSPSCDCERLNRLERQRQDDFEKLRDLSGKFKSLSSRIDCNHLWSWHGMSQIARMLGGALEAPSDERLARGLRAMEDE